MILFLICKVALGAPLYAPKLVLLSGTGAKRATIFDSRCPSWLLQAARAKPSWVTDKEAMLAGELNYYLHTDGQTDGQTCDLYNSGYSG